MMTENEDKFNLGRFVQAQEKDYDRVLLELRTGRKESHWMWYVFPQLVGLGHSPKSQQYAIQSIDEATAYLDHPILGTRLLECMRILLELRDRSATEVLGTPNDFKLQSCATLFACVSPGNSVPHDVLEKYFSGRQDARTIEFLKQV
jgi:uncharacterized protein (DUF1810 family)